MKKPKHGQQSSNDNAKDQLGDDEIVVSEIKKILQLNIDKETNFSFLFFYIIERFYP